MSIVNFKFLIFNFGFAEDAHAQHSSNKFDLCTHSIASFNFQLSTFNFQFSIKNMCLSFIYSMSHPMAQAFYPPPYEPRPCCIAAQTFVNSGGLPSVGWFT